MQKYPQVENTCMGFSCVLGSSISHPSLNFINTSKNNMSRRLVRQAVQSQVEAHEPWGTRIPVLGPEVLINPTQPWNTQGFQYLTSEWWDIWIFQMHCISAFFGKGILGNPRDPGPRSWRCWRSSAAPRCLVRRCRSKGPGANQRPGRLAIGECLDHCKWLDIKGKMWGTNHVPLLWIGVFYLHSKKSDSWLVPSDRWRIWELGFSWSSSQQSQRVLDWSPITSSNLKWLCF